MKNFRLYSFVNHRYMSPLQHGLQTAHAVSEMSILSGEKNIKHYKHWAKNDKTICILQGGNHAQLENLYKFYKEWSKRHGLALVKFNEDEQSLNGACTCVAMVVPDTLWDVAFSNDDSQKYYTNKEGDVFSEEGFDFKFINVLKTAKTA